ncbi:MAG: hypothetical protein ACTSSG_00985 [Candidatus Heimdallarchaeaceae archaeon]
MKSKKRYQLMIPDSFSDKFNNFEDFVDQLFYYYDYLSKVDINQIVYDENLDDKLEEISQEFSKVSQKYGKLKQEYGILNFKGNELFTRNTLTGLKLGLLMNKLERAKSIWGSQIRLSYEEAKELILHFTNRYLFKKEEEE